ncbi:MAG: hypothetical protein A2X13_07235 [Bacteroidetes bacterium GWC2_33_15]|nr:MAG: hypothetical protein A2X10_11470 [Bacteroidetes bacterium GWA2_33_15]OFX51268.1 MAG: hypothetical protein A2X13_07235 [Bacteroidetes bacterium GWC2_33_15]OFX64714.1 MAG: hypothetical protein A2X15_03100 [Bacteroidetes bacterium GWB2_32_14]OFX70671.1 MAG: hypothetical protein A2X14_10975 [Bacteroidetes bacterium GWD2_33_33]HAN20043.1 hypothetical protein [Bacteroidales bacterium]
MNMIKKHILIASITLLSTPLLFGQSLINSPYSRFGIGEIENRGFSMNRAMGNLSTGIRKPNQINFQNPASIGAQDTMSFIFDLGVSGISKTLGNTTTSSLYQNFYFDHLAMSFPIKRWWFLSVGLVPYSKKGYDIQTIESNDQLPDTVNAVYNYYGNGSINQLFLSNSFKIYKNIHLGFNVSYLFGSIEQYNILSLDRGDSYSTVNIEKTTLKKLAFDFGLQYTGSFSTKYFYTLGFVYSNKIGFNATRENTTFMTENFIYYGMNVLDYLATYSNYADTILSTVDKEYKVEVPAKYSFGFSSGIKDKLTVGIDVSVQDWNGITSLNMKGNSALDINYNLGVEYIPNKFALRNYLNLINYRAGFYYNTGYLELNNEKISSYGITFGVGLPIANKTTINLYYNYGVKGTTNNGLIEEKYNLFGINLTLYDFWFFKYKYE